MLAGTRLVLENKLLIKGINESTSPTNTSHGFHVETTWKRPFPRRFNVESTWCVCWEVNVPNIFVKTFKFNHKDTMTINAHSAERSAQQFERVI